jgi:hypothetical protein
LVARDVTLSDVELAALVGRRFRGGVSTIEHWENWLLTDCTRREPMGESLLHPVSLFHLPIRAADTSIAEMFGIVGGDGSPGSVTLLGYDWEYVTPLYESVAYRGEGGVTAAERHRDDLGRVSYDDITFTIALLSIEEQLVARSTIRWRVNA